MRSAMDCMCALSCEKNTIGNPWLPSLCIQRHMYDICVHAAILGTTSSSRFWANLSLPHSSYRCRQSECCNKGAASNQSSLGQQRLAFLPGLLPGKSTTVAAALAKVRREIGNSASQLAELTTIAASTHEVNCHKMLHTAYTFYHIVMKQM